MALALTFWQGIAAAAGLAILLCGIGAIVNGRGIVHDLEDLADDDE